LGETWAILNDMQAWEVGYGRKRCGSILAKKNQSGYRSRLLKAYMLAEDRRAYSPVFMRFPKIAKKYGANAAPK
jgi:hypothetical protein